MPVQPFTKFYEHVFALLSSETLVTDLVTNPATNIRPTEDRSELSPGAGITYSFEASQWDNKRKRGTGIFNVNVTADGTKVQATKLLEAIREAMTPRKLRDALGVGLGKVNVPLFRERPAFTDSNPATLSNRIEAVTSFDVKLIEV